MFYYEKYNAFIMVTCFVLSFLLIFLFLRKRVSSIIDPLVFNIIWCASGISLLVGFFFAKSISIDGSVFALTYAVYLFGLFFFQTNSTRSISELNKGLYDDKNVKIFYLCIILNLISRLEFFSYAMSNPSIVSWFLYRFKQWEGRSFWQYILQLGARPFFFYYIFVLLKTKPHWRLGLIIILLINSTLDIIAGGRSAMLGVIEYYGFFIYYFKPLYNNTTIKKINWYGLIFVFFAIASSILVTSFYSYDGTIEDSIMRMINRVLAAGDGLEMYLYNNASLYIKSGIGEYLKATFGVFIKRISSIHTQSIGWKLFELNSGVISPISVGPNFILPLQVVIIGKLLVIPYTLFISFATAFLRGNWLSKKIIRSQPLSFVLGLLTFQLVVDAEFFVLQLSAYLFVYFLFIFPVRKIKLTFDWKITKKIFLADSDLKK